MARTTRGSVQCKYRKRQAKLEKLTGDRSAGQLARCNCLPSTGAKQQQPLYGMAEQPASAPHTPAHVPPCATNKLPASCQDTAQKPRSMTAAQVVSSGRSAPFEAAQALHPGRRQCWRKKRRRAAASARNWQARGKAKPRQASSHSAIWRHAQVPTAGSSAPSGAATRASRQLRWPAAAVERARSGGSVVGLHKCLEGAGRRPAKCVGAIARV